MLHTICCSTLRTLASLRVCFYVCLRGETWLLSLTAVPLDAGLSFSSPPYVFPNYTYLFYRTVLLIVHIVPPGWVCQTQIHFFFHFFFFFHLTYSRWTSSLPSCLWSQRIFPSLPGSRLTIFLSRCKFSTLTTRQPMIEFYLLTFPRFPLRKKEHKSYFGKNRTHDFRTSRCAAYLLDHSGDDIMMGKWAITLWDSFALHPWHLRVNLPVKALVH